MYSIMNNQLTNDDELFNLINEENVKKWIRINVIDFNICWCNEYFGFRINK